MGFFTISGNHTIEDTETIRTLKAILEQYDEAQFNRIKEIARAYHQQLDTAAHARHQDFTPYVAQEMEANPSSACSNSTTLMIGSGTTLLWYYAVGVGLSLPVVAAAAFGIGAMVHKAQAFKKAADTTFEKRFHLLGPFNETMGLKKAAEQIFIVMNLLPRPAAEGPAPR